MIKGFTFPHKPLPAVRTTGKMLWTKPAQNYAGYKQALATALAEAYPDLVVPPCPPATTKKADPVGWEARKEWEAKYKGLEFWLTCEFSDAPKTSDLDNLAKTVMDALQLAGIVPNDCMVTKLVCSKVDGEPYTWVRLAILDPKPECFKQKRGGHDA
jgi:hypothetical protein